MHGFNSYMKPAHATTKASRSRCMDLIHIWNLLMLQLKHQEVVAWINSYMEHAHATTAQEVVAIYEN